MSPPTSSATSGSLRLTIAFLPTLLIPIGLGAVIREDLGTPAVVSHVRPVILVETGSVLEQFLLDVQNEPLKSSSSESGVPGRMHSLFSDLCQPRHQAQRCAFLFFDGGGFGDVLGRV